MVFVSVRCAQFSDCIININNVKYRIVNANVCYFFREEKFILEEIKNGIHRSISAKLYGW